MITIKSGVPGSGKTQSAVAEMLEMHKKMLKPGAVFRPIYTNIDGLALPHFPLPDAKKWTECPPESIIIIDEAQDQGFEAIASQMAVPDHVKKLAQHRKDYSVDIMFITQHPKLLHMALRRQCGLHQHYERKFGMKRAFVLEWHNCEDNLGNRKIAVLSRFEFKKEAMCAYKSAEVHTKSKFKLPMWIYLPLLIVPLGVWAVPHAYANLSSALTGKGLAQSTPKPAAKNDQPKATSTTDSNGVQTTVTVQTASAPIVPASGGAVAVTQYPATPPPVQQIAGCIATPKRCSCYTPDGSRAEVEETICRDKLALTGAPKTVQTLDITETSRSRPGDAEILATMLKTKPPPMALLGNN